MKTVLPSDQVAHIFASNSQDSARNSKSSVSFETTTCGRKRVRLFKSYSTGIAFYFLDKPETVYFGDQSYSITTSGHQSGLRSACSHLARFSVLGATQGYTQNWLDEVCNAKAYKKVLTDYFSEKSLRISRNKRPLPKQSAKLTAELETYSASYAALHEKPLGLVLGEKLENVAKKHEAKQERDRKTREAYYLKTREAYYLKTQKERAEAARQEMEEKLPLWRSGEQVHLPYHDGTFLRLKNDGMTVETSHGTEVPLDLALAFYTRLSRGEAKEGQHVGSFTMTSADNDTVVIGCHKISRKEMAGFYETVVKHPADTL